MDSLGNMIAEKKDVVFKKDVDLKKDMDLKKNVDLKKDMVLDRIFSKCDKKELDKLLAEREQEILRARDAETKRKINE
jgi:6-phosphogluconate dehydrogenase